MVLRESPVAGALSNTSFCVGLLFVKYTTVSFVRQAKQP